MSTLPVTLRTFTPGDEDLLNRLKRLSFPTGFERMRPDFWRWQYVGTPHASGGGVVAERDGAIVGFIGYVRRRIRLGRRDHPAGLLVDLMVDPSLRGQRIGTIVSRRVHEDLATQAGAAASLGLANPNSFPLLTSPGVGMRHVMTPSLFLRPLRGVAPPPDIVRSAPVRLGVGALMQTAHRVTALLGEPRIPESVEISELRDADERVDRLWGAVRDRVAVICVRDAAYVEWRYLRHPVYSYRVLLLCCDDLPVAYVVLAERTMNGMRLGQIVDYLVDPRMPTAATWLVAAALRWGRETGVDALILAGVPGMPGLSVFRRWGWLPLPGRVMPRPVRWIVRPLAGDIDLDVLKPERWFWTWGDCDVV